MNADMLALVDAQMSSGPITTQVKNKGDFGQVAGAVPKKPEFPALKLSGEPLTPNDLDAEHSARAVKSGFGMVQINYVSPEVQLDRQIAARMEADRQGKAISANATVLGLTM